jgi:prepilin-type N-terminal cleavage/methylation domain-containing protein
LWRISIPVGNPSADDRFPTPALPDPNMTGYKGVSLIELLITISLISIITGLASVSYQSLWSKEQLRVAADDLVRQFQTARMRAILENRSYYIRLEQDVLQTYGDYLNRKQLQSTSRLNETIQYRLSGEIGFSAKGFASPKTVTLTKNDQTRKIIININGRIRND